MPSIRLDITSARRVEHDGDKSVRTSDKEQNFVGFFLHARSPETVALYAFGLKP